MGFLSILLLVIFAVGSLLLIIMVLLQDEQGEGIGGIFGGGSTTFGSRSGNVLTRFTTILGAIFIVCSFALAWLNKTPESGDVLGAARRGAGVERSVNEWWVVGEEDEGAVTEESGDEDE